MTTDTSTTVDADREAPYRKRCRIEWARLLRQVFAVDILRCHCGGERKVIAALTRGQSPDALRRYLDHIPQGDFLRGVGEPTDPLPGAPVRAPPQTELPLGEPADALEGSPDAVDPMPNGTRTSPTERHVVAGRAEPCPRPEFTPFSVLLRYSDAPSVADPAGLIPCRSLHFVDWNVYPFSSTRRCSIR